MTDTVFPRGRMLHPDSVGEDIKDYQRMIRGSADRARRHVDNLVATGEKDPWTWAMAARLCNEVGVRGYARDGFLSTAPDETNESIYAFDFRTISAMADDNFTVFDIDTTLSKSLSHTSFKGVELEDINLPSDVVYLNAQGHLGIEGVYLLTLRYESGGIAFGFCTCARSDKYREGSEEWIISRTSIPKEGTITDLESYLKQKEADCTVTRAPVMHWMFNVLLYITHVSPGENWIVEPEARKLWEKIHKEKNPRKRRKLADRLKKTPHHKRKRVIDRTLLAEPTGKGTRGPLTVKTLVMGIWRRPPGYRTRMPGYKMVWVKPHWRGPKDAPISQSRRMVKAAALQE